MAGGRFAAFAQLALPMQGPDRTMPGKIANDLDNMNSHDIIKF